MEKLLFEIQPAFSGKRPPVWISAPSSLKAIDIANLKYPDARDMNFFGLGKPEPWRISRVL